LIVADLGYSQNGYQRAEEPRVVIPTHNRVIPQIRPVRPAAPVKYPWKTYVTATIFWCGEQPTDRNPTPNCKSSWDIKWMENFGGYDNPDPKQRIANHTTGEFRPKNFVPKLNPFYIALPYNDVMSWNAHKPEASKVIPWFSRMDPKPGKTVLKGRWIQIFVNQRSCYAQWEDCGPWVTDDWQYVFGNKPPKATQNGSAGIDISPAVRDYLSIQSGTKIHWRFVEESQVPYGPWKKYGNKPDQAPKLKIESTLVKEENETSQAEREYLEYLRELRERQFSKKP
jgi:hypothetical protein